MGLCSLSHRPTRAPLTPVRRLGEPPSFRGPYTPCGGFGGGDAQRGNSNLCTHQPQGQLTLGACIELQTLTGSRDKDMNKVLHGSLLRAHDDPGFQAGQVPELGRAGPATTGPLRLSSKRCSKGWSSPGLSHRPFLNHQL